MIISPAQRTRALYAWENLLEVCPGNGNIGSRYAQRMTRDIYWRYAVSRPAPKIEFRCAGVPYAEGYGLIVLTDLNCRESTAVHEITHARGFGTARNPHSASFCKAYIDALAWWFSWEWEPLYMDAKLIGLL